MSAYVLILHDVDDYAHWKTIFDGAATIRKAAGEISFQVLAPTEDTRRVVHFSRWRSLDTARAFFESPELVAIRQHAGVRAPEFRYLDELDSGIL